MCIYIFIVSKESDDKRKFISEMIIFVQIITLFLALSVNIFEDCGNA